MESTDGIRMAQRTLRYLVSTGPQARREVAGYNNNSNQRQTDNKSSLLELEVVQNEWYDGEREMRDRGSLRESEGV